MKLFLCSLLCMLIPVQSSELDQRIEQGTIVAYSVSKDAILIGADSKTVDEKLHSVRTECKIALVGNIAFAFTGVAKFKATGLDIEKSTRIAASGSRSPIEAKNRFKQSLMPALHDAVSATIRIDPKLKMVLEVPDLLEAVFAGFENGKPAVGRFRIDNGNAEFRIINLDCPAPCGRFGDFVFGVKGVSVEDGEALKKMKTGTLEILRAKIEAAIRFNPIALGPPISILRLTARGAEWLDNKENCDQQAEKKPKAKSRNRRR